MMNKSNFVDWKFAQAYKPVTWNSNQPS